MYGEKSQVGRAGTLHLGAPCRRHSSAYEIASPYVMQGIISRPVLRWFVVRGLPVRNELEGEMVDGGRSLPILVYSGGAGHWLPL